MSDAIPSVDWIFISYIGPGRHSRLDNYMSTSAGSILLAALFLIGLTACDSGDGRVPPVANNGEWSLKGRVVSEISGDPLQEQVVSLISLLNKKCFLCQETEAVVVVSVITGKDGGFNFRSQVAGNFDVFVRSSTNHDCVKKESLGVIDVSKDLDILLKVPDKNCILLR